MIRIRIFVIFVLLAVFVQMNMGILHANSSERFQPQASFTSKPIPKVSPSPTLSPTSRSSPIPIPSPSPSAKPLTDRQLISNAVQMISEDRCKEAIPKFDHLYWTSKQYYNDALFYIVFCQTKLGKYSQAKKNIGFLDVKKLTLDKRKLVRKIKAIQALDVEESPVWSVFTYAGGLFFNNSLTFNGGYVAGVGGAWNSVQTQISLGIEQMGLFSKVISSFSQWQFSGTLTQQLSSNWMARVNAIYLSNSDVTTTNGRVGGGNLTYRFREGQTIHMESFISYYPSFSTDRLQVTQVAAGFSAPIIGTQRSLIWEGKLVSIYPDGKSTFYSTLLNQLYFSGETAFRIYYGIHSALLGGWMGNRIFAVQNDASTIYNAPVLHNFGLRGSYGFALSPKNQISVFSTYESTLVLNSTSTSLAIGSSFTWFL